MTNIFNVGVFFDLFKTANYYNHNLKVPITSEEALENTNQNNVYCDSNLNGEHGNIYYN